MDQSEQVPLGLPSLFGTEDEALVSSRPRRHELQKGGLPPILEGHRSQLFMKALVRQRRVRVGPIYHEDLHQHPSNPYIYKYHNITFFLYLVLFPFLDQTADSSMVSPLLTFSTLLLCHESQRNK
jgi:hypothetical protein